MKSSSPACGTKGYTLVEILIASTLMLLLLALTFQVIVPTFRTTSERSARVELEQVAALAVNRVVADLESTAPSGVGLLLALTPTDPTGMVVHPLLNVDASGGQVWDDKLVVVYFDPGLRRLTRWVWEGGPPAVNPAPTAGNPLRVSPDTVRQLGQEATARGTRLASDVTEFSIGHSGSGGTYEQPFSVEILLQKPGVKNEQVPTSFRLRREVYLRNY